MDYFTADHHFGHGNIVEFCNRPFADSRDMDDAMISKWNQKVGNSDVVYHLGDLTLRNEGAAAYYLRQLNGRIRILSYPWHHDKSWIPSTYGASCFMSASGWPVEIMPPMVILEYWQYGHGMHPKPVVLCHYPLAVWDRQHYGSYHLHGHSHAKYEPPDGDLMMDIGVDATDFFPISIDEVVKHMRHIEGTQQLIEEGDATSEGSEP